MYCKFVILAAKGLRLLVLIVAKCIVNEEVAEFIADTTVVLIVAKCIVNLGSRFNLDELNYVLIVAKCIVNSLS